MLYVRSDVRRKMEIGFVSFEDHTSIFYNEIKITPQLFRLIRDYPPQQIG